MKRFTFIVFLLCTPLSEVARFKNDRQARGLANSL